MRQEIKLSDAIGKTLEAFAFSNINPSAVLVFTDGTFAGINAECFGLEDNIDIFEFGDSQLIESGVVSPEEMAELRRKAEERQAAATESQQRAEYERLRRKFESQPR